ncbi:MAG TPA: large conductance mechanosensitive channel protein MscL [Chthoniobacterales bacterium]|jgi:large conductance mechanosensitive channel
MNWFHRIWKEFREFAIKGNAIDLAVAVIIGGAFSPIVNSLVNDVIMPPIGLLTGGVDFRDFFIQLNQRDHIYQTLAEAKTAHAVTLNAGLFFNTVINFLIVGFTVFLLVRGFNKLKHPTHAPVSKDCPACTMTIPIKATRCPHCTTELAARAEV